MVHYRIHKGLSPVHVLSQNMSPIPILQDQFLLSSHLHLQGNARNDYRLFATPCTLSMLSLLWLPLYKICSLGKAARGVKLTTHFNLASKSRMSETMPPKFGVSLPKYTASYPRRWFWHLEPEVSQASFWVCVSFLRINWHQVWRNKTKIYEIAERVFLSIFAPFPTMWTGTRLFNWVPHYEEKVGFKCIIRF
jgi:hypothetical protein